MVVFVLWIPTRKFAQSLNADLSEWKNLKSNRKLVDWATFENEFALLRQLSGLVTRTFGNIVICFILECIMFYSSQADFIIGQFQKSSPDWKIVVLNILYVTQLHCILLLSANIPAQVTAASLFIKIKFPP